MLSLKKLFRGLYKTCDCKCGYLIPIINKNGRLARYKTGHNLLCIKRTKIGGRTRDKKGYWYVYLPDYFSSYDNGYVREHVYFFQEYHDVCMLPWGHVHHIIPVTKHYCNNMPWNLEGMMRNKHQILHKTRDMSYNKCSKCGSFETSLNKKGRPIWIFINGICYCRKCGRKEKWKLFHRN